MNAYIHSISTTACGAGYYFNASSGQYYDANSGLYFDSKLQQWLAYDQGSGQYTPVATPSAQASTTAAGQPSCMSALCNGSLGLA